MRKEKSLEVGKRKLRVSKKTVKSQNLSGKPKKVQNAKSEGAAVSTLAEGKHHDIIKMILDDHKPLKRCIEILKNLELNLSARRAAFSEFAPLLTIHAKAEEAVLYNYEKTEIDMREEAFEGDVEHALAEQMIEDVKQSLDKDIWSAKIKVLAELVEHHIKEEEAEMFIELKREADQADLIRLGENYMAEKNRIKDDVLHPSIQKVESGVVVRH